MVRYTVARLYLFVAVLWVVAPTAASGTSPRYVRVLESSPSGISIAVEIPGEELALGLDPGGFRTVTISGIQNAIQPGSPSLPVVVLSVGIPTGAIARLSHETPERVVLSGPLVATVPSGSTAVPDADDSRGSRTGGVWPTTPVELEQARIGELEVAKISIYPLWFDSAGELVFTDSLRLSVTFEGGSGYGSARGAIAALERRLVERRLLNGATVARQRDIAARDTAPGAAPTAGSPANPGVRIGVETEGLVRVTRLELEGAGFDTAAVDPRHLELSYRGAPIPCRIRGEADGVFDADDVLEFFGVPNSGRYTTENAYWLSDRGSNGLRFPMIDAAPRSAPQVAVFPSTEHYEEANNIYTFGKPAQEGDPHFFWIWFEDNPSSSKVTTFTHSATLPGLAPSSPDALFRAYFSGRTDTAADPDHRVRFFVNDTQVGETTWDGKTHHVAEIPFAAALLVPGSNDFRLDHVAISNPDYYYLDWIEIDYPRETSALADRLTVVGEGSGPGRYAVTDFASAVDPIVLDVTNPFAPLRLSGFTVTDSGGGTNTLEFEPTTIAGRRFHLAGDGGRVSSSGLTLDTPSDLRNPSNGADLLIVVPEGWEGALADLVAHRQSQGLRVVLANLTDVADEFAGGNADDVAIRDFVAYAYDNWQSPAPAYLLLVGEPNLDPLNDLGESPHYHLMPIHFAVTNNQGETLSDTWFGAVSGDDPLPEVAVSRFSVRTASEATDVAAKVIAYENDASGTANWISNVLHVASDESGFENALENSAQLLPTHYSVDTEYRTEGANAASIGNAFDSGAVISSFLGHGNVTFWADSPGGPFYGNLDVLQLSNAGRLPFVTALNCLNGLVGHPFTIDSMGEVFHNDPTRGALAVWSPSAFGFLAQYDLLQQSLYETIFVDHVPQIGLATTTSLVETYLTQPVSIDLVKEHILLGDASGWIAVDSDGDQGLDALEIRYGTNPGDRDSDDDGLLDGLEGGLDVDSDADGVINALDPDADNDALPDGLEAGVAIPDADTDLSKGLFLADTDPGSTTDPFDVDTDDGGAPDGFEDPDADGNVDAGETDPLVGADDPACAVGQPPEVAAIPGEYLLVGKSGANLVLTWGDAASTVPCVLYKVYVADDMDHGSGGDGFRLLGVTASPTLTHTGAGQGNGPQQRYLIVAWTTSGADGPWGHFGS